MSTSASYGLQLWVDLYLVPPEGGPPEIVRLDVIRCAANFPLNDRPRCSLAIALGRRMDNVNEASPIHRIIHKIRNKQKAYVYLKVDKLNVPADLLEAPWPTTPFVVFEGETTGFGYQRTSSSVEYVLNLEHWLSDLAYSSTISALSSPSNPSDFIFNARSGPPQESVDGVVRTGGMTGMTDAASFVDAITVPEDLWGSAIQPWFIFMTTHDTIVEAMINAQGGQIIGQNLGDGASGNATARAALERFEPRTSIDGYELGAPLDFDPAAYGGDMDIVSANIAYRLCNETLQALASSTMWDKLVTYASEFQFAIVPLVDRALIVPYIPGLRYVYEVISGSEYDFARFSGSMPRILRGVGVFGGTTWEAGSDLDVEPQQGNQPQQANPPLAGIGGYYQGATSGLIIFKQAPAWMVNTVLSSDSSSSSGGGGDVRSSSLFDGVGPLPLNPTPEQQSVHGSALMNRYAQCLYAEECLKAREGDLSGKLRFDISPGSSIKIEGCGEKFLGLSDALGDSIFASVLQVDFVIDCETPRASTAFHIAHIRGRDENGLEGTSVDRHPLWRTRWSGAPLIPFE